MKAKHFSVMVVPDSGKTWNLHISRRNIHAAIFSMVALFSFGLWGSYSVYIERSLVEDKATAVQALVAAKEKHLREINQLNEQIDAGEKKLAFYARNIGEMQARLSRLDALGERLVGAAKLDDSEFNFALQPAFGGPRIVQSYPVAIENMGVDDGIHRLNSRLTRVDAQLAAIDYILQQQRSEQTARPHAWPSEGGWISSHFGIRTDPFTGKPARHRGVDLANRFGAPVLSASRGIVTFAGKMKDFGYIVDVAHGYGYVTRYGHMSSIMVSVGDDVKDGQLIGRVGSSGRSTGPHLHFEVHRYGQQLDPANFLPRT